MRCIFLSILIIILNAILLSGQKNSYFSESHAHTSIGDIGDKSIENNDCYFPNNKGFIELPIRLLITSPISEEVKITLWDNVNSKGTNQNIREESLFQQIVDLSKIIPIDKELNGCPVYEYSLIIHFPINYICENNEIGFDLFLSGMLQLGRQYLSSQEQFNEDCYDINYDTERYDPENNTFTSEVYSFFNIEKIPVCCFEHKKKYDTMISVNSHYESISINSNTEIQLVEIFYLDGKKLLNKPLGSSKSIRLNSNNLKPGLYVLSIKFANGSSNSRLFKY